MKRTHTKRGWLTRWGLMSGGIECRTLGDRDAFMVWSGTNLILWIREGNECVGKKVLAHGWPITEARRLLMLMLRGKVS